MHERRHVIILSAVLVVAVIVATGATSWLLYRTAFRAQENLLQVLVTSQALLIEEVLDGEARRAASLHRAGGLRTALPNIVSRASHRHALGETGEFLFGLRTGSEIVFLPPLRHSPGGRAVRVSPQGPLGRPLRLALAGGQGTVVGPDYRGETVLAAYSPVRGTPLGITAKIDLKELRAPFVRAWILVGFGSALLALVSVACFLKLYLPMTRRLHRRELRYLAQRRQAEERMRLAERQLVRADKMRSLGLLASSVAHEISNPNNFIMFNTPLVRACWSDASTLLRSHGAGAGNGRLGGLPYHRALEAVPRLLDAIQEGSQRISHIVSRLRDFARASSTGPLRPVELGRVIDSAVSLMHGRIRKATHHFHVACGTDLLPVAGRFHDLEQVLVSLIANACEALPDPEQRLRVVAENAPGAGTVVVRVTGEGAVLRHGRIPPVEDPRTATAGTDSDAGLAWSVAAGIAREHGGRLDVEDDDGAGVTATLRLPAMTLSAGPPRALPPRPEVSP